MGFLIRLLTNVLFATLLFALTPGTATAAPPPPAASAPKRDADAKARAQTHFERGAKAYKEGRYKDAIDAFLDAHREYPSPSLSFNTARAYERMGDNAGALRFYREYLRQSPGAEDRTTLEQKISELEKKVQERGVQQVTVLSNVEGATVKIDGRPVGVAPWTGEILPGRHQVMLRFEGYQDAEQEFELSAHRAIDVSVEMTLAPKTPEGTKPPREQKDTEHGPDKATKRGVSPWTWTAFGVGAAALGGALAFELMRSSAEDDVRNEQTQLARHDAFDRMESRQQTARILAGVGGAAVVIGGVLLYFDLQGDGAAPKQQVGLGCGGSSCGAVVRGHF